MPMSNDYYDDRKRIVMDAIRRLYKKHRRPPTQREIQRATFLSSGGLHTVLGHLREDGLLYESRRLIPANISISFDAASMPLPPNKTDALVYMAIMSLFAGKGRPPTFREVQARAGLSSQPVWNAVHHLKISDYLEPSINLIPVSVIIEFPEE